MLELPKILDSHSHFCLKLLWKSCLDLGSCDNFSEIWEKLSHLKKGKLNLAVGYHNERFALDKRDLEKLPPLVIINYSLHGFTANREAIKLLNLNSIPPEQAMLDVWKYWAANEIEEDAQSFRERAVEQAKQWSDLGLYGACDMLSFALPIEFENFYLENYYPDLDKRKVKIFLDGSLGAKTAAFTRELLLYEDQQLYKILEESTEKELAIHAIGPLAIEQILNAIERLTQRSHKIRLEHCQFIDKTQALRAKGLNLILSMQPNFNRDSFTYKTWLGLEWAIKNNPFRMLIDEVGFQPGKDLIFGSDNLPLGLAPALETALFGELEEQRLSLEELLKGYRADSGHGTTLYDIDYTKKRASLHKRREAKF